MAIDNPTDKVVELTIDSLTIELQPKQLTWVEMGTGTHKITLPSDSTFDYTFSDNTYFLNAMCTEYLERKEYYGNPPEYILNGDAFEKKDTTNYIGFALPGSFTVYKDIVTAVSWDVFPREDFPESVEMEAGINSYTVMKKIYDPYEFYELVSKASSASQE